MAEENTKDEQNSQSSKKSYLKLIIIASIVLLLGAGGFFGYNKFKNSSVATAATPKKPTAAVICPLKSFVVNLLDKNGVAKRYLKLTIEIEVGGEGDKQIVDSHNPQLTDSILMLLSSQTFEDIKTMDGKLALKQELLSRMRQVLGDGVVRRVYFTEFVVQ